MIENAQSTWKRIIKKAKEQVFVFTSDLDDTLVNLLAETKVKKTVVTCIDIRSCKNIKQINALKKLSKQGVSIRHLKDLQANVLLVDREYMTVGSQSFKDFNPYVEGTVLFEDSVKINRFISKTINKWIEQSKFVDDFTIDCLAQELSAKGQKVERKKITLQTRITEILNRTKKRISIESPGQIAHFKQAFSLEATIEFNDRQRCYILAFDSTKEIVRRGLNDRILPILNRRTGKIQFGKLHETATFLLCDSVMKQKIPTIFYQLFKGYKLDIELYTDDGLSYHRKNLAIRLIFDTHTVVSVYTRLTENGFYDIHVESNHAKLEDLVKHKLMTFRNLPEQNVMAAFLKDPKYFTTITRNRVPVNNFLDATRGRFTIQGMEDRVGNAFLVI